MYIGHYIPTLRISKLSHHDDDEKEKEKCTTEDRMVAYIWFARIQLCTHTSSLRTQTETHTFTHTRTHTPRH